MDRESGEIIKTAVDAMAAQLHEDGDKRRKSQRDAEALTEICRRSLSADHGKPTARRRSRPQLSVISDLQAFEPEHPDLVHDIRIEAAHFGRLSRATLKRWACDCEIARVIIDGDGVVIDVGRSTRNISDALWRALVARDKHCTEPGCHQPPGVCEAHHIGHWENGGPTDLANLKLGCWAHHRQWHLEDARRRARGG